MFLLLNLARGTLASEHNGSPGPEQISLRLSFNLHEEYPGLDELRSHTQMDHSGSQNTPSWTLQARPTTVHRPRSQAGLQRARLRSLRHSESEKVEWEAVETLGPDIEDRHTLAQLARMTGNAYALPGQKNWYDIDPNWNNVCIVLAVTVPFWLLNDYSIFILRAFRLGGKMIKTDSEAMSSSPTTSQP
jgi:hypothetical protein